MDVLQVKWVNDNLRPILDVVEHYSQRLENLYSLLGQYKDSEYFRKLVAPSVEFYAYKVQTYSDVLLKVVESNVFPEPIPVPVPDPAPVPPAVTKALKGKKHTHY